MALMMPGKTIGLTTANINFQFITLLQYYKRFYTKHSPFCNVSVKVTIGCQWFIGHFDHQYTNVADIVPMFLSALW